MNCSGAVAHEITRIQCFSIIYWHLISHAIVCCVDWSTDSIDANGMYCRVPGFQLSQMGEIVGPLSIHLAQFEWYLLDYWRADKLSHLVRWLRETIRRKPAAPEWSKHLREPEDRLPWLLALLFGIGGKSRRMNGCRHHNHQHHFSFASERVYGLLLCVRCPFSLALLLFLWLYLSPA